MSQEQRKTGRYHTTRDVDFSYDFDASLEAHPVDRQHHVDQEHSYKGRIKNISLEGLCFDCQEELHQGDLIALDVYVPGAKQPVHLQGEVRWIKPTDNAPQHSHFDTGVKLTTIEGKNVHQTVRFDQEHGIYWSEVLESILGAYRIYSQNRSHPR